MSDIDRVKINRKVKALTYPFSEVFSGFDRVRAVRKTFGKNTKSVLDKLKVQLHSGKWAYMWIDVKKKCLACNIDYVKKGDNRYLYLDIVHELVHIRQMHEGKELFDKRYEYLERPTEIEAYKAAIDEAKKIGMS